jgi:hypothetical protein
MVLLLLLLLLLLLRWWILEWHEPVDRFWENGPYTGRRQGRRHCW